MNLLRGSLLFVPHINNLNNNMCLPIEVEILFDDFAKFWSVDMIENRIYKECRIVGML